MLDLKLVVESSSPSMPCARPSLTTRSPNAPFRAFGLLSYLGTNALQPGSEQAIHAASMATHLVDIVVQIGIVSERSIMLGGLCRHFVASASKVNTKPRYGKEGMYVCQVRIW